MISLRLNLVGLFFGAMFGGILAAGALHEYETIHNMLRLEKFYVFGFMGSAITVAIVVLAILETRNFKTVLGGFIKLQKSDVEANHISVYGLSISSYESQYQRIIITEFGALRTKSRGMELVIIRCRVLFVDPLSTIAE